MQFFPVIILITALCCAQAAARESLPGPVPAQLIRVIDGDSIVVDAQIWPRQRIRTTVRLAGIDAPELNSRCAAERERARQAATRLAAFFGESRLYLHDIRLGKYAGRVVAHVLREDQANPAADLLAAGYAVQYDGRGKRTAIC